MAKGDNAKKTAKAKKRKRRERDLAIPRKEPGEDDERHTTLHVLVEVPLFCRPSQEDKIAQSVMRDVKLSVNTQARGFRPVGRIIPGGWDEIMVPDHVNE